MIIETHDLSRSFGRCQAVRNVHLELPEGAAMALVGANSAGKTTLLRLLVNILRPTSGSARVLGCDTRRLGPSNFQQIGYVSEGQTLPQRLSVAQHLEYLRPLYEHWDAGLEQRLLCTFELSPDRKILHLSHGARMKVMLVSALCFRPRLLVLDEPLGGLDPSVRDEVLGGLIDRAGETTILMATHELAEIEGFATHVAFMADGRLQSHEELGELAWRVREVTIRLPAPCDLPRTLPETWRSVGMEGRSLSFIDQSFVSEAVLAEQIATVGLAIERLEARPLSLREIAAALMRPTRSEVSS